MATTLATLAQTPLYYRSASNDVGNTKSTTGLGADILEDAMPERCVLDGHLVQSLREVVNDKLAGITVTENDVAYFKSLNRSLDRKQPVDSEEKVRTHLHQNFLAQAEWILTRFVKTIEGNSAVRIEDVKQQQRNKPDLALSLDEDELADGTVWTKMVLFECKSEGITRTNSNAMVDMGRNQQRLAYDNTLTCEEKLVSKV